MGIIIYIIKTTMLTSDNRFALNGSIGGISGGIKFADNALTCDSEGNCMLKDELIKARGCVGKFCASVSRDDDDLVDDLGFKKFMKKAGKSTVKVAKSAAKGTVKAVKSIAKSDVGKAAIKTGSKMAVDTAMASLKDELISIGGRVGKFSGSVKFDDDDDDDDDLVDELTTFKDQVMAAHKKRYAKVMAQIDAGVSAKIIAANGKKNAKAFVGDRTLTEAAQEIMNNVVGRMTFPETLAYIKEAKKADAFVAANKEKVDTIKKKAA